MMTSNLSETFSSARANGNVSYINGAQTSFSSNWNTLSYVSLRCFLIYPSLNSSMSKEMFVIYLMYHEDLC